MNDIEYKKALLRGLGESEEHLEKLESIVGQEEFLDFLSQNQENGTIYTPLEDFSNVKNKKFRANLHIHTTNSDGLMRIEDLLELGAKYADSLPKDGKNNKLYLAITDHNTTKGVIEALKLIIENPNKYKNLKIILGVEASAIFNSKQTGITREVHLLSYCLNPFVDTISMINNKRLQIFQYGIKNALNNANIQYIDTINKYNIDFNFEDMAKIRPSIKTCASNVRYSMKDYLQFRLLYAHLVENNKPLVQYLTANNTSLEQLDFSQPKNMITHNKYNPYWKNYIEQLHIYLEQKVLENNKYINIEHLRSLYTIPDDNLLNELSSIEAKVLDPNSNMYIREPSPLLFNEVIQSFNKSESAISGVAHGGLYESTHPKQNLFLQDLYRDFKESITKDTIIGETYYPYPKELNYKIAEGFIRLYGYIKTGGLDSHKNNFFTPQTSYDKSFLEELVGNKTDKINPYQYLANGR